MRRGRVLAVRRTVEPSPRAMEGAAALRLYSTSKRSVEQAPKKSRRAVSPADGTTHRSDTSHEHH